jgi:hypothetical protein
MGEVLQSAVVLRTTLVGDVGLRLMGLWSSSLAFYQIVKILDIV